MLGYPQARNTLASVAEKHPCEGCGKAARFRIEIIDTKYNRHIRTIFLCDECCAIKFASLRPYLIREELLARLRARRSLRQHITYRLEELGI